MQNGMVERNAGLPPERRIECRVGVHLGDVVEESDGDLMGDGVNIAARLEGVAKPGAICLSEQAYWQVKGRLDVKVTDLGATQLKNIAEPIRVYSLEVGPQAPAEPVRVRSTIPVDHQAAIERIRAKRAFGAHDGLCRRQPSTRCRVGANRATIFLADLAAPRLGPRARVELLGRLSPEANFGRRDSA